MIQLGSVRLIQVSRKEDDRAEGAKKQLVVRGLNWIGYPWFLPEISTAEIPKGQARSRQWYRPRAGNPKRGNWRYCFEFANSGDGNLGERCGTHPVLGGAQVVGSQASQSSLGFLLHIAVFVAVRAVRFLLSMEESQTLSAK